MRQVRARWYQLEIYERKSQIPLPEIPANNRTRFPTITRKRKDLISPNHLHGGFLNATYATAETEGAFDGRLNTVALSEMYNFTYTHQMSYNSTDWKLKKQGKFSPVKKSGPNYFTGWTFSWCYRWVCHIFWHRILFQIIFLWESGPVCHSTRSKLKTLTLVYVSNYQWFDGHAA